LVLISVSRNRDGTVAGSVPGLHLFCSSAPGARRTVNLNYDQPMTAAIFGLIGVVVGGLLNGAVTAWQARRTDASAARVGARLVDLELRQAALALAVLERAELTASETKSSRKFSTTAWDKYQEVLARTLSDKDWQTIAAAYEIVTGSPGRKLASTIIADAEPTGAKSSRRSDAQIVSDATFIARRVGERPSFGKRVAVILPYPRVR
jgi:hypothetical protein